LLAIAFADPGADGEALYFSAPLPALQRLNAALMAAVGAMRDSDPRPAKSPSVVSVIIDDRLLGKREAVVPARFRATFFRATENAAPAVLLV
jgi:hypothetical protein